MWAVGWLSQVGGHEFVSIDLMDASSDGALSPARTNPLSKHSLFILIGSRGCWVNRHNFINKNKSAKRKLQNFCVFLSQFRRVLTITVLRMFSYNHRFYFLRRFEQIRIICIMLLEMFNHSTASHPPLPFSHKHPTPTRGLCIRTCACYLYFHVWALKRRTAY